jgi:hypothetical protein
VPSKSPKQAADKLREIFDTIFRMREPMMRADPLTRAVPVIASTEPAQLIVGGAVTLNVLGRGFQPDSTASINGRAPQRATGEQYVAQAYVPQWGIVAKGELQLIVRTPGAAGESSEPFTIPK